MQATGGEERQKNAIEFEKIETRETITRLRDTRQDHTITRDDTKLHETIYATIPYAMLATMCFRTFSDNFD